MTGLAVDKGIQDYNGLLHDPVCSVRRACRPLSLDHIAGVVRRGGLVNTILPNVVYHVVLGVPKVSVPGQFDCVASDDMPDKTGPPKLRALV